MRTSAGKLGLVLSMAFAAIAHADVVTGTSNGTFNNPIGDAGLIDSGAGTNQFIWGDPDGFGVGANSVTFTGSSINSFTDTPFAVGAFAYFNGTTAIGTNATGVEMDVALNLTAPTGINQVFDFQLAITTTTNGGVDPAQDADIVSLTNTYSMQTFVANGNTYTLLLLGFVNPNVTGGFVDGPGNSNFHVYEGATGTADLQAEITLAANVPEPYSVVLLGTLLVGVAVSLRRKLVS